MCLTRLSYSRISSILPSISSSYAAELAGLCFEALVLASCSVHSVFFMDLMALYIAVEGESDASFVERLIDALDKPCHDC